MKHSLLTAKAILNLQCRLESCTYIVSNLERNFLNIRVCLLHEDIRLYCLAKAASPVWRFVQRVELSAHPLLLSVTHFAVVALNEVLDRLLLLVNRSSAFCVLRSLQLRSVYERVVTLQAKRISLVARSEVHASLRLRKCNRRVAAVFSDAMSFNNIIVLDDTFAAVVYVW